MRVIGHLRALSCLKTEGRPLLADEGMTRMLSLRRAGHSNIHIGGCVQDHAARMSTLCPAEVFAHPCALSSMH